MTKQVRPRSIRLEATTHCQLRCPSCPTTSGRIANNLGRGYLGFEDLKTLVDENPFIMHIELSNWGEMFLNPELPDIMRYAFERGIALTASNGVNLNAVKDETLEALVKYQFRHLTCSIDGASQESYAQYRRRGNFDRVIANVKKINELKKHHESDFPLLTWQFIAFGHNEHEIDIAREMAQELNMDFYVKLSWDSDFSPVKNKKLVRTIPKWTKSENKGRQAAGSSTLPEAQSEDHGSKNPAETRDREPDWPYMKKENCIQLWNIPQINWDGRVLGCCVNYWGDFGNAFDSGLASALNGDKLTYAKQMLQGLVGPKEGIPCSTCHNYKWMHANKKWITEQDIKDYRGLYKMPYALGRTGIRLANRFPSLARAYLRLVGITKSGDVRK